jgi:flagellar assembly protein FliH
MIRLMPNLPLRPQLVSDDGLSVGECALETHLGSVDLGVKAQLAEIERGFFDLLERREPVRRDELRAGMKPEEA